MKPDDLPYFVHESAYVDEPCEIGEGTKIWHFTHVCAGARIGASCTLGQNVYVAPTAVVGDRVKIQNNVSIYDGVVLEDDVFVGPSAVFTNVFNPRAHVVRRHEFRTTRLCRFSSVGANATIVCGTTLHPGAFVAAGAVVTKDVAPYVLVKGVPARPSGFACACGHLLGTAVPGGARGGKGRPVRIACPACGARYGVRAEGGLEPAGGDRSPAS
jgi:UDP-2-acetamido-3-amino-2,3-dideoxy-glucuronate N-acetyltransferase